MRIHFERSGGFMGLHIAGTVDTDTLPDDVAVPLQEMIQAAGLSELPQALPPSSSGADLFQYKLVVEDDGREYTIETSDSAAPDTLRALLRRLTVLTRSQPGLAT